VYSTLLFIYFQKPAFIFHVDEEIFLDTQNFFCVSSSNVSYCIVLYCIE